MQSTVYTTKQSDRSAIRARDRERRAMHGKAGTPLGYMYGTTLLQNMFIVSIGKISFVSV
jgi:hypothetical protein